MPATCLNTLNIKHYNIGGTISHPSKTNTRQSENIIKLREHLKFLERFNLPLLIFSLQFTKNCILTSLSQIDARYHRPCLREGRVTPVLGRVTILDLDSTKQNVSKIHRQNKRIGTSREIQELLERSY